MFQRRAVGVSLAVVGGLVGLFLRAISRKPTATDILEMDEQTFGQHLHATGLEGQVRAALARIDRARDARTDRGAA